MSLLVYCFSFSSMSLADELPAHGLFVAVKATPSSMSQMCSSLTHCLDGDLLGPLLCGAGLIQSITLLSCFPPHSDPSFFSAFHNHYCFHGSLCDCMHPFWGFGQGPIHPKLQRELTKMGFGLIGVGFQISLNCVWFLLDHFAVRFAALFLAVIRVNLPKVHRFLFFGCVFFCAVIPTALSNHMDPTILSLTGTLRLKSGGGESRCPLLGKCTIAFTASQGFS